LLFFYVVGGDEVLDLLGKIHELKKHNEIHGRDCKSIVMSKVMYHFFRDECMKVVGIPGDVTMYLGMSVVVLDRDDDLIMIG
jgi:hypothetical protein